MSSHLKYCKQEQSILHMASSGRLRWFLKRHEKKIKYVFQVLKIEPFEFNACNAAELWFQVRNLADPSLNKKTKQSSHLICFQPVRIWSDQSASDETQAEAVNATYFCKTKKVFKALSELDNIYLLE